MYTIRARFHGPTNHRGSRFSVTWGNARVTVPFDYAASRPSDAAIREALRSRRFIGNFHTAYPPEGAMEARYMLGTLSEAGHDGDRVAVVFVVARSMADKPGEPFPPADRP